MKKLYIALLVVIIIGAFGCSSMMTVTNYKTIDEKIDKNQFDLAIQELEKSKSQYKEKDKVLYYLNYGMLAHCAGKYEESSVVLQKADFAMEEAYTKSVAKAGVSLLLNDNSLTYSGEDYENIYTNVFNALNYLQQGKSSDGFVEIRRMNEKLNKLEDKYKPNKKVKSIYKKTKFYNDALGRFLSLLMYRTEGKYDDARIDYRKIIQAWKFEPNLYNFKNHLSKKVIKRSKNAKLDIIAFCGKSPIKKSAVYYITSHKNYFNITSFSPVQVNENIPWTCSEGYHFKFSMPYIQQRKSLVSQIKVKIDENISRELFLFEDMGRIAEKTFDNKRNAIYAKTLIRTITKGILAEKQKAKIKKNNTGLGGSLLSLALDVGVDLTENADLRLSHYFPDKAYLNEVEIPSGTHSIQVEYYDRNGNILYVEDYGEQNISKNGLNLIESFYYQ